MKKVNFRVLLVFAIFVATISSCTSYTHTMREPSVQFKFDKSDMSISGQDTAVASSTTILGIDFERLFLSKSATLEKEGAFGINIAFIPVVGAYVTDRTQYYALYNLMEQNPGYDFVLYPQFEKKVVCPIGIPIIKTTTVKVTARMGKLNN